MGLESPSSRGVSESLGVAVLVVLTIVATVSVGMTVTFVMEDGGEFGAEFTFDHSEDLSHLLIFYDAGEELQAGDIVISGPANEVTWAELDEIEPDETVEPSNVPVRLSEGNAYGSSVSEDDFIEIRHVPEDADEDDDVEPTVLETWNDPADQDDDGFVDPPDA